MHRRNATHDSDLLYPYCLNRKCYRSGNRCVTIDVTFTGASNDAEGSVAAWDWDFGDGSGSTDPNPSHSYAAGGSYNVTLTVTDNEGASDSASQQVTVSGANQPPAAEFSFTTSGLSAAFTDLSDDPDGTIVTWSWDFGDGATDSIPNPSHIFPSSGTYDVLLTATDNDGATDTFGQQVTVSDGSGVSEMVIGGLSGTSTPDGGGSWNAVVTILVTDEAGDPVTNATVSGTWSKGFFAATSCTTDANGQCTVEQTGIGNMTRRVTFAVDDVTHSALTYNSLLNVVSSIRVNRP